MAGGCEVAATLLLWRHRDHHQLNSESNNCLLSALLSVVSFSVKSRHLWSLSQCLGSNNQCKHQLSYTWKCKQFNSKFIFTDSQKINTIIDFIKIRKFTQILPTWKTLFLTKLQKFHCYTKYCWYKFHRISSQKNLYFWKSCINFQWAWIYWFWICRFN